MTKMYTKETLHELDEDIEYYKQQSKEIQERAYYKDVYSNRADRNVKRLTKLKKLISMGLHVEHFGQPNFGLVEVNSKYVLSLLENNWRTIYKNKWYKHSDNVEDFVNTYILNKSKP
jgi:hypothetical protein